MAMAATEIEALIVISPIFAGMSRVRQHQLVYKALGGRMGGELHALQLETAVPSGDHQ